MRCYSHLSDDERAQIGLAKALGHSVGAIARAIGRPKSTIWRELCRNTLPSVRYFTPPEPINCAGGVKR
jgi:transposase, IS30 family